MNCWPKLSKLFLAFTLSLATAMAVAQPPKVEWQHTYGGSLFDGASCICATSDGGCIVTSTSASADGDLAGNYGEEDAWVFKLDLTGKIQWQRRFGGSRNDDATAVVSFSGGYIIAGYTASTDNGINGKHGEGATTDYLVIRLDNNGNLLWQKCFGGTDFDYAYGIDTTMDGGFIVTGMAASKDGDVTGDHGNGDIWMVKLNSNGAIEWQRSVGGINPDVGNNVKTDRDGNFIVVGFSFSGDSDVGANNRNGNVWLFKISKAGGMQWQRSFGGNQPDYGQQVILTKDGGYAICGIIYSDTLGNHGGADYYLIKLSQTGDTEWEYCYGGSGYDVAQSIIQAEDGGFLAVGYSFSNNSDVTSNNGGCDGWLLKVDAKGKKQWEVSVGGLKNDRFLSIVSSPDSGYLLAGVTESATSDMNGIHGMEDAWVVKIGCNPVMPGIQIDSDAGIKCPGEKITFTSNVSNAGSSPVFQWIKNNNNVGTSSPVYEDAFLKENDSVVCRLIVNNSCALQKTVTSNTVIIKTLDTEMPKLAIQTTSSTVCKGLPVQFKAVATPSSVSNQYSWFVNDQSFAGIADSFKYAGLNDGDLVYARMVIPGNCLVNTPISSDTLRMKVMEGVLPSIFITASDTSVCQNDEVTFFAETGTAQNPRFEWMVNGVKAGSDSKEFSTAQLSANDAVSCRVTVNDGCIAKAESNKLNIQVHPLPVVVCMKDTTITTGAVINLYGFVSGDYASVLWSPAAFIQNNTSVNQAITTPLSQTVYRLTAITKEGCSAYGEVLISVKSKSVIPNAFSPNKDGINDYWQLPFAVDCNSCFVSVFDRYGRMVLNTKNYSKPWDGSHNNRPLPDGVYYYTIRNQQQGPLLSGSVTILR